MTTAIPNIPAISTKATPAEIRRAFDALRAYFASVQKAAGATTTTSAGGSSSSGGSTGTDLSIPPAITGLVATGAFNSIILQWDAPTYSNHAYTEVHRAETDNLGIAVFIGSTPAAIYSDTPPDSSTAVTYYYWIRNVSMSGVVGPFQATHGASAQTADDPGYLLEVLTGEITASQLFTGLNSRIDLIDTPTTGLVDQVAVAKASAATANALIADIASDSKLTPVEKSSVRGEWEAIAAEKAGINSQATAFGITTENTTYNTKFQALADYLNNGTAWSSGIPSWISDANLASTTTIVGSTFRTKFKEYYDARTALLNAIASKAKTLADAAQTVATAAQTTANTAVTNAANAQADADAANTLLTDIASDSKLTASEKQQTKVEWDGIVAEKAGIDAQADAFGITTEKTAYGTAYSALSTYITPLLSSLTTTSTIVGTTFRSTFSTFYSARQALLNKIAAEARTGAVADAKVDPALANSFTEANVTTIRRPVGGSLSLATASNTGAIKITLPQYFVATMLRFKIEVFNYASGKSFTAIVAGYIYSTSSVWANTSAQIIGNTAGDNAIRFGHDGAKCCIWIGETASVWAYPKITVLDVQAGYSNYAISQWATGWSVSIVTSFGTVQTTYADALLDAKDTKRVAGVDSATLVDLVNDTSAAVDVQATAVAGIQAKYSVKVDVNGYVAGYGLIADANNGTPTSAFGVLADKFWVCSPGVPAKVPFVVSGGATYMDIAMIKDATITSAKIASLAADKVVATSLAAISANLGTITAGMLNYGSFTGYAWPASGTGAHLSPSGLLLGNANTGQYFQVSAAGAMSAPGLTISGGNATFSGTLAANTVRTANIVAGNVTTATINGNAVTVASALYATTTKTVSGLGTVVVLLTLPAITVDAGQPIILMCDMEVTPIYALLQLYRDSTLLREAFFNTSYPSGHQFINLVDTPGAGSFVYSIKAKCRTVSGTATITPYSIVSLLAKR